MPDDATLAASQPTDADPKPKPSLKRRAGNIAKRIAIMYAVYLGLLIVGQRWVIFPDYASPEPGANDKYDNATTVLTRDIGGGEKVIAWFVPCQAARKGTPSPLVIYFHGNAEIIDSQEYPVETYRAMGCTVLLPEFRGYGRSGGQPSETSLVDDAVYFLDEAMKRPDVDKDRIVIHGRSMGGGVAAQLAARRKPKVLLLGSSFTSLRTYAKRYLAPPFLLRSTFDTDRVLPTLDVPVLVHHGTHDNIVPVEHGRELSKLAKNCTYIEYDCSHNDFPGDKNLDRYPKEIEDFLKKNGVLP